MGKRIVVVVVSLVLLLALASYFLLGSETASPTVDVVGERTAAEVARALPEPASSGGARAEVGATEGAPPSPPAAPDDLRAQLRRVGLAEKALFEAGESAGEDLRVALEETLGPILFHPETIPRILDLLRSGELAVRLDHLGEERVGHAGKLGLAEYGAVRSLYWAILTYNAPYGAVHGAGLSVDGEAVLMEILLALPDIEDPARSHLLDVLIEARLDEALVLDASWLEEILRLRALFPEHEAVFSALLVAMGEGMTPEERTAFFSVFLPETDDAILLGVTLRNLLRGSDPDFALWLAGERFDDEGASRDVRYAIAGAVVEAAEDPYAAAAFLTDRVRVTTFMPELFLGLGARGEDALTALDTTYRELLADGAVPRARALLVAGMREASGEKLLDIAIRDPDPAVRGQAFLTLTSAGGMEATPDSMRALREAFTGADNGIPVLHAVGAASNLAGQARSTGREEVKDAAVSFLLEIAENARLSRPERLMALRKLESFLDGIRWADLERSISER